MYVIVSPQNQDSLTCAPHCLYVQPPISTNPPKTDESQLTLKRSEKLDLNGFKNINTEDIRVPPSIYEAFVELTLKDLGRTFDCSILCWQNKLGVKCWSL